MMWQREAQHADATFAPDGRFAVTAGGQVFRTQDGSLAGMSKVAAPARFTADGRYLLQFDSDLRLHDIGGKHLKTFEASGLPAESSDRPTWVYVTQDQRYAIQLARDMASPSQTGIVIYERRDVLPPFASVLAVVPAAQTVAAGSTAIFSLAVSSEDAPLSYQWKNDGIDLPGATGPILTLPTVTAASAGSYVAFANTGAGWISTTPALLGVGAADPTNPSRLANLAVRARVGADPLVVGFSLGGAGTGGQKPLLIRGAGPSLVSLIEDVLSDPQIAVFVGPLQVAENRDWAGDTAVSALTAQVSAFPFVAATSRDAALATTAVNGSYTAQLASSDGSQGMALAEIYDASPNFNGTTPRLTNVSARTDAGSGANTLIAGFTIAGSTAKVVLVRGVGPGLFQFGIGNAMVDPRLTLFRDETQIATNDNWYDAPNALAIAASAPRVAAFALPVGSRDAAILISLPPGQLYSAGERHFS